MLRGAEVTSVRRVAQVLAEQAPGPVVQAEAIEAVDRVLRLPVLLAAFQRDRAEAGTVARVPETQVDPAQTFGKCPNQAVRNPAR